MGTNICDTANNPQRIPKGQSKMNNPEKLATRRIKRMQKQNTICVGHHYAQTNANSVNKTLAILQTTGVKGVFAEIVTDITIQNSECKDT